MQTTHGDALLQRIDPQETTRRISSLPAEGYVLDPWSGLYQESEATFQQRLRAADAMAA